MDIELTTENLQKLCRICLNDGVYNIWKHKVQLEPAEAAEQQESVAEQQSQTKQFSENETTIHEMLQIYHDWEHSVLALDNDLQLVCESCLDELLANYYYYRKLLTANRQLKQLYEEAQQLNIVFQSDEQTTEALQPLDIDDTEYTIAIDTEYTTALDEKVIAEIVNDSASEQPTSPPKQAQKRKLVKNPKFVLTGGVTQLLTHAALPVKLEEDSEKPIQNSSHKRPRKQELHATATVNTPTKSGAFLVTQFIPTATVPKYTTADSTKPLLKKDAIKASTSSELRTMDYTTVEIQGDVIKDFAKQRDAETSFALTMASSLDTDANGRAIYVCKYCPQAFSSAQFLITHARKSHVCKYCTQAFAKNADLFAHIKQAHQSHKCAICSKALSTHSNLRAHLRRIHGIKLPAPLSLLSYRPQTDEVKPEECLEDNESLLLKEYDDATEVNELSAD